MARPRRSPPQLPPAGSPLSSPATRSWASWAAAAWASSIRPVRSSSTALVALKMILAGEHTSDEAGVRFLTEAATAAKLQHPNIVQIFHIAEHAGHPFFEMEFVAGGSLADGLDGIPRSPRAAAKLVECLARAIGEAHRLGIIHRDLKPANILMTPEGTSKIADFGLVKLLDVESGLTRTDSVLGSPSYMAPEQAEGKTKEVGPAADLYALGAILYELLTGRPPFRGATVLDTLQQVRTDEPVPPSRMRSGGAARRRNDRLEVPAEGCGQAL